MTPWNYRLMGFALMLLYTPAYAWRIAAIRDLLRQLSHFSKLWGIGIYTLVSYALVSAALLSMVFGAGFFKPKTLNRLSLFLVLYLWPHTLLAWFWNFSFMPNGWID